MANQQSLRPFLESKLSGSDSRRSETSPSDWDMPMPRSINVLSALSPSATNPTPVIRRIAQDAIMKDALRP